jgi:HSP20 family protein
MLPTMPACAGARASLHVVLIRLQEVAMPRDTAPSAPTPSVRDENPHQGPSHSFGRPTDTATETRERERAIRTGRERGRWATALTRRSPFPVSPTTPFGLLRRMAEDMDRIFQDFTLGRTGLPSPTALLSDLDRDTWRADTGLELAAWSPQVETFRRGDKLVIRADLPGLRKEDVRVEIDDDVLMISGERSEDHEEERDDVYRSERVYGRFYRGIPLPEGCTAEQCEASFKDGVLEVRIPVPKTTDSARKQIPVR